MQNTISCKYVTASCWHCATCWFLGVVLSLGGVFGGGTNDHRERRSQRENVIQFSSVKSFIQFLLAAKVHRQHTRCAYNTGSTDIKSLRYSDVRYDTCLRRKDIVSILSNQRRVVDGLFVVLWSVLTVLRPSVCRLSVTLCIVAKRCVIEQKLLLTVYRKSHIGNRVVPKWMTLTFV